MDWWERWGGRQKSPPWSEGQGGHKSLAIASRNDEGLSRGGDFPGAFGLEQGLFDLVEVAWEGVRMFFTTQS